MNLNFNFHCSPLFGSKHNPILMNFCKKLKDKGKIKMSVIEATMRKLLHIIFAMVYFTLQMTVVCCIKVYNS